ncbi:hypothetical protein GOP47_0018472 [Adiantum capillus-veneris]|uniref:Protein DETOXIFICATION n=1 Tax=Adiantum capillus-veneris TaxID=13818 RepID=A0A9D4UD65_ADICA|nr:hypothetical protein GOP47_0018472 [Adiantum capillus-veneris]
MDAGGGGAEEASRAGHSHDPHQPSSVCCAHRFPCLLAISARSLSPVPPSLMSLTGLASALDTLCGQAYGAQQYSVVGLYLQRGLIVLYACSIPLAIFWANMKHILLALGQDAAISRQAGEYTLWLIPTLFTYAANTSSYQIYASSKPCHSCCDLLYMHNVLPCTIMLCPDLYDGTGEPGDSSGNKYFNLHKYVPSAVMMCLEWWSYEALVILSGWLPNPELETSVISVCYNCAAFAFMVPSGLGAMASTRVANELGAGRADAAQLAVYVSAGVAACEAILVSVAFISLRTVLGKLYSKDEEVIAYIAHVMPILAVSCMLDSIQGLLSGIARGCGWQKVGAYINLASYYGVGLPVAFVLAFVFHIKAEGLWLGISRCCSAVDCANRHHMGFGLDKRGYKGCRPNNFARGSRGTTIKVVG